MPNSLLRVRVAFKRLAVSPCEGCALRQASVGSAAFLSDWKSWEEKCGLRWEVLLRQCQQLFCWVRWYQRTAAPDYFFSPPPLATLNLEQIIAWRQFSPLNAALWCQWTESVKIMMISGQTSSTSVVTFKSKVWNEKNSFFPPRLAAHYVFFGLTVTTGEGVDEPSWKPRARRAVLLCGYSTHISGREQVASFRAAVRTPVVIFWSVRSNSELGLRLNRQKGVNWPEGWVNCVIKQNVSLLMLACPPFSLDTSHLYQWMIIIEIV